MKDKIYFESFENIKNYGIINFTVTEVENTGCGINQVKIKSLVTLQTLRTNIKRRIHLLYNGIASGEHKAIQHPEGGAIDFYFDPLDGTIHFNLIFEHMVLAGFYGIGVYYCEQTKIFTFHGDLRNHPKHWYGYKKLKKDNWSYSSILKNPQEGI